MKLLKYTFLLFIAINSTINKADTKIDHEISKSTSTVNFLNESKAKEFLRQSDHFSQALSQTDMMIRLRGPISNGEIEFLSHVSNQARSWSKLEEEKLNEVIIHVMEKLKNIGFSGSLPSTLYLIKTTGWDEFNNPYTRRNAIILPESIVKLSNITKLQDIIAHELFHIMSRYSFEFRHSQYSRYNYKRLSKTFIPPTNLERFIVTNPDAHVFDYYIEAKKNGQHFKVVPFALNESEKPPFNFSKVKTYFFVLDSKELLVDIKKAIGSEFDFEVEFDGAEDKALEEHAANVFPKLLGIDQGNCFSDIDYIKESGVDFDFEFGCQGLKQSSNYQTFPIIFADLKERFKKLSFPDKVKVSIQNNSRTGAASLFLDGTALVEFDRVNKVVLQHEIGHLILAMFLNEHSEIWRYSHFEAHGYFSLGSLKAATLKPLSAKHPDLRNFSDKFLLYPYHEIFADLLVAIYYDNPKIISEEIERQIVPFDPNEETLKRNMQHRSFTQSYESVGWSYTDDHELLTPSRSFLWSYIKDKDSAYRDDFILVVLDAIKDEYEARSLNFSLRNISPEEANRRFMTTVSRKVREAAM